MSKSMGWDTNNSKWFGDFTGSDETTSKETFGSRDGVATLGFTILYIS